MDEQNMEISVTDYQSANDAALAEIQTALQKQGHPTTRVKDCLRLELSVGDKSYGFAYFASATFLFSLEQHPKNEDGLDEYELERLRSTKRDFKREFREYEYELFSEHEGQQPRKELSLFVIGSESYLKHELEIGRRSFVEQDERCARKMVLTLDQALGMLANPFPICAEEQAELGRPTFDTVAELVDLAEDAPPVTDLLTLRSSEAEPDAALLTSTSCAALRRRVDSIVLRVLGPEHRIFWDADGINIGRIYDRRGVPLYAASSSEQKVFAFALFLAKLAETANANTRVGIHGALNGLGLLIFTGALETLREFVLATGASVRLQIPQRDKREWAEKKLGVVAQVTQHRVPYR
ncbi:hypothetical protein F6X40_27860 [Paraburkholderia sp. UCT31]|uniref:hypothetical protein n=1 Tax=Paraburkholderia sp. UCT31 TaxID=2615209 RepID=UPI0016561DCB|nr:hypothetical protein [Paraburkholderia sp. UCT31]MBC8740456.1 hypothetical protein [Paraburkholderia sp. UCT31]